MQVGEGSQVPLHRLRYALRPTLRFRLGDVHPFVLRSVKPLYTFDLMIVPRFYYLAVRETIDGNPRYRHLFAGRGNAHELALMGPSIRTAVSHHVSLSDHVLDDGTAVGESDVVHVDELFDILGATLPFRSAVREEPGGVNLVGYAQVPPVKGLPYEALNEGF